MIVSRAIRRKIKREIERVGCYTLLDQFHLVRIMVNLDLSGPYCGEELELARAIGAAASGPFYHGGPGGLSEILPAGQTGNMRWDNDKFKIGEYSGRMCSYRLPYAYFAQRTDVAKGYADQVANGVVYRVQPTGDVLADIEFFRPVFILSEIPGHVLNRYRTNMSRKKFVATLASMIPSYCAQSARVLEVIE